MSKNLREATAMDFKKGTLLHRGDKVWRLIHRDNTGVWLAENMEEGNTTMMSGETAHFYQVIDDASDT